MREAASEEENGREWRSREPWHGTWALLKRREDQGPFTDFAGSPISLAEAVQSKDYRMGAEGGCGIVLRCKKRFALS